MGQCQSDTTSKANVRSVEIDKDNAASHQAEGSKLILLGPGESGKSTFMKQVISIYGQGHEPSHFTQIIYKNVLSNMQYLIDKCEEMSFDEHQYKIDESLADAKMAISNFDLSSGGGFTFDGNAAAMISGLWADPAIRELVGNHRSKLQLLDSAPYFFEKVEEIGLEGYEPSLQDIVLSRVRTTGINECSFILEGHKFTIADVGGQRSERKKWIHLFEDCTGVIFFTALSEYDQTLFENEDVNRMEEGLKLFAEICNSRWFADTPVILFLNKKDLFAEKVKSVPISDWVSDCPLGMDEQNYENGVDFFKKKFESLNRDPRRKIYTHTTCVIDESVKTLFGSVADIIMKNVAENLL